MNSKKSVYDVVFKSIDQLNEQLPKDEWIEKKTDTALYGEKGLLDSLGLINLISIIEENSEDDLGVSISLASEEAMTQAKNPFETVDSLTDYIFTLI